ncbi:MAG TPA: NHL repeat-containing protein [Nevskiaceae bacterium]|nr:NHL repeat-containing protein [Nevskiaceae bacterium]
MKLLKQAMVASLSVSAVVLAACGGGGSSTTSDNLTLASATLELGQADFTGGNPNQGTTVSEKALNNPQGNVATNGTLFYVVDTNNSRVLGYNAVPTVNNTGANFALGQPDLTSGSPNNNGGTANLSKVMAFPSSVAISGTKLVVTDTDNNRVLIWNTLPTGNVAPDVVVGQAGLNGSASGTTSSTLSSPQAAMIANGKLVVADTGNNRVLIWNTVPTTNGVAADVVLGQADFVSNVSVLTPTQASLRNPQGVWTDGFNLLVADSGTNRVLYWKQIPTTNNANALYVMGQPSFIASAGSSGSALMKGPTGVFYDGTRIFVADTLNNRVLVFNGFPLASGTVASAVLGQEDFSHSQFNDDNGAAVDPQDGVNEVKPTQRTLFQPTGVMSTGTNVYVSDTRNNRIMVYAPPYNAPGS